MKWVGFVLRLRGGDTPAKFCSHFTLFFKKKVRNKINKYEKGRFCAALKGWRYSCKLLFTFYTLLQKNLGIKSISMKRVGFVLRLRGGDTPAKFCS